MQNWGRTRRFLIYPAVNFLNNRRSNPIAADPVFNSAFGIRSAIRFQHRGFGSDATKIQRNPLFSTLNSEDISYFKGVLGEKNVIQDEERLLTANTDWMHKYRGSSKLLLQPRSTEEVSQILKYCNSRSLAVVPQGGNTGLVGGSVPVFDEVVINVSLMNNIISFDKDLINSSNRILVKNTTKMMFYEL